MAVSCVATTSSLPFPLKTNLISSSSSSSSSSSCSTAKITSLRTPIRENRWGCSMTIISRFGSSSKGGSGILERPNFDQSQFTPMTQAEEGGDMGRFKHKRGNGSGDSYRVLLVDDERHTEKLVAKILPQAVPSITPDDARKLFHESREKGAAVVIVAVKEHAEFYSQMIIRGGLRSIIEPDSNTL